jgi:hypothetical protein
MSDNVIPMEPKMKLYSVRSKVKEFSGCRDVVFNWFRSEKPAEQRPYAKLIANHNPSDDWAAYGEVYVDELFTEDEALQLKEYLDQNHREEATTEIRNQRLPIVPDVLIGFRGRAVGGGDGFYELFKEPQYSLPFKVEAYFDLVGRELVDGSDVYHHRLLLVLPDGTVRVQTNEEAAAMERAKGRNRDGSQQRGYSPF